MKIRYRSIDDPLAALEKQGMRVDELQLPDYILALLKSTLHGSNAFLPESAKRVQRWDVGLLQRE